jgi:hypothetical protein
MVWTIDPHELDMTDEELRVYREAQADPEMS